MQEKRMKITHKAEKEQVFSKYSFSAFRKKSGWYINNKMEYMLYFLNNIWVTKKVERILRRLKS